MSRQRLYRFVFTLVSILSCTLLLLQVVDASSIDDLVAQGDEALSMGENEQAIASYEKAVEILPKLSKTEAPLVTVISLFTNLATAFSSEGRNEPAADAYQKALLAYSEGIDAISDQPEKEEATFIAAQSAFFLGMVYQDMGQPRDAIDAYRYTTTLDPLQWASFANLGSVYQDNLANYDEALAAYNEAYAVLTGPTEPTDPPEEPQFILSELQYRIGLCLTSQPDRRCAVQNDQGDAVPGDCRELAAHAFSLAVQYNADNAAAKHMLASLTADATIPRADTEYVQNLFDNYAENFEHSLVQELGYNGYERLRRGYDRFMTRLNRRNEVVDLVVDAGCGTGLVGEQFRNVSQRLIGVDLSASIIEQGAKTRPGLYDETRVGDVMMIFSELAGSISLILAGDSYIYFGDLMPLFQSMYEGLQSGGYAAFTLENVSAETEETLAESKPTWRWQLTASGRFAHRRSYVEAVSQENQLKVAHYEPLDDFRFEHGVGVRGHLFILEKPRTTKEEL